jgi:predicted phosphoribosyltransferase
VWCKSILDKFKVVLRDRASSGNILAGGILDYLEKDERKNVLVLGIPRGGVIVADVIARKLGTSHFDIVLPRKLLTPNNEENAFGAIMEDGSTYIDFNIINKLSISQEYLKDEKKKQISEMIRRSILYRNSPKLLEHHFKINDKDRIVILVDDGAATGSTLISLARWIRNRKEHKFKKIIIVIPVAPKKTISILKNECDYLEIIFQPSKFATVSHFYKEFLPVTDQEVIDILSKWKENIKLL